MRGVNPACSNSFIVRSWLCGRERRSGTSIGSSAISASVMNLRAASAWRCGNATIAVSWSRWRNSSRLSGRSGGRTKARSSAPVRIFGRSRIVLSSSSCTATSGCLARKSRRSGGNRPAAALSIAPTRSRRAAPARERLRKLLSTASTRERMARASRKSVVPSSVSETARVVRANSRVPRSSSRSLIWRPSAEGSIWRCCAARPKCSCSAAATKHRSWCNSIRSSRLPREDYIIFLYKSAPIESACRLRLGSLPHNEKSGLEGGQGGERDSDARAAQDHLAHRSLHHAALLRGLHRPRQYRLRLADDEQGHRPVADRLRFWRRHLLLGLFPVRGALQHHPAQGRRADLDRAR